MIAQPVYREMKSLLHPTPACVCLTSTCRCCIRPRDRMCITLFLIQLGVVLIQLCKSQRSHSSDSCISAFPKQISCGIHRSKQPLHCYTLDNSLTKSFCPVPFCSSYASTEPTENLMRTTSATSWFTSLSCSVRKAFATSGGQNWEWVKWNNYSLSVETEFWGGPPEFHPCAMWQRWRWIVLVACTWSRPVGRCHLSHSGPRRTLSNLEN